LQLKKREISCDIKRVYFNMLTDSYLLI